MAIPPPDIRYVADQFVDLADALIDSWDGLDTSDLAVTPTALCEAIEQLLVVLRGHEEGVASGDEAFQLLDKELAEMVSYGIKLLAEAASQASRRELPDVAIGFEDLTLPLALWGARHGTELADLEPVVNGLVRLTEQLREPVELGQLYQAMDAIIHSTSPKLTLGDDHRPRQPWRLLIVNRAVVATRCHQPQLMTPAFDAIVELLPDEVTHFFTQGMGQLDAADYPEPVRAVLQDYYLRHAGARTLH